MYGETGMNRIYFDNAATTRITEPVLEAMMPYLTSIYGNPSAVYETGREARKAIEDARKKVADALGARPGEIYFTAGGTESDNWALRGAAYARKNKGRHLITSAVEHHAVLHTMQQLEKEGFEVTYLPVDKEGFVRPEDVQKALRGDTTLVSIMMANNEIGTLEPVEEIGTLVKERGILMHTDAVQAVGNVEIDLAKLPVDMLSLSGHKFHAPKGVGALYIQKGTVIDRFMRGGAQEWGQRAGTENLASIVGLGEAIRLATQDIPGHNRYITELRDTMLREILERIPDVQVNGPLEKRLPGNLNLAIRYVEGEALLLNLDLEGIAASTGSACTSGSVDPSHVLLAAGVSRELAHSSVRFSFSEENTPDEVSEAVETLERIVHRLRLLSPLSPDT